MKLAPIEPKIVFIVFWPLFTYLRHFESTQLYKMGIYFEFDQMWSKDGNPDWPIFGNIAFPPEIFALSQNSV